METQGRYVMAIRAGSRLRFAPDEQLEITVNVGHITGVLTFRTRYSEEGFEHLVPREMWIDARGYAKTLVEAIEVFTNTANTLTTLISFCMNGYAGECQFHLGYEDTPDKKHREFFEQFVQDEKGMPLPSRNISSQLVISVIEAVSSHQFKDRLMNAIVQYVLALEYWKRGSEILATAHLFMGIEALVRVARDYEIKKLDLNTNQELADSWGISIKDLDSKIRQDILFQGDQQTHKKAKEASDGIEHGFLSFTEVRPLAEAVRDKTATYLRQAIIKLLTLPEEITQKLLARPYDQPIGTIGYVRYLRGELIAEHDQIAPPGQMYPVIEWRFSVQRFSLRDNKLEITFQQTLTPRIGKDVTFSPKSLELFGPEGIISEPKTTSHQADPETNVESENSKRTEVIAFTERVWEAVSHYGSSKLINGSLIGVIILALFSKCKSQFHSVLVLIKQGLPYEGFNQARLLWINTLYLCQIAYSENRDALALGLELENIKQSRQRMLRAYKHQPSEEITQNIKLSERSRRILLRAKRKLGIQKLQEPEFFLISAANFCSPESGQLLIEAERMTSGSVLLDSDIIVENEGNGFLINTHSFKYKEAAILCGFVIEAILLACKSVAMVFNWEELKETENFLQQTREWLILNHDEDPDPGSN